MKYQPEKYRAFTARIKSNITVKFGGECQSCHRKGKLKLISGCYYQAYEKYRANWRSKPIAFEVHHKVSLSEGGTNDEDNLTLLCRQCHRSLDAQRRREGH